MSSNNIIRNLYRLAWVRAKETEGLADDDPIVKNVQNKVIRTIAELEVSRSSTDETVCAEMDAKPKKDDEPIFSAVA